VLSLRVRIRLYLYIYIYIYNCGSSSVSSRIITLLCRLLSIARKARERVRRGLSGIARAADAIPLRRRRATSCAGPAATAQLCRTHTTTNTTTAAAAGVLYTHAIYLPLLLPTTATLSYGRVVVSRGLRRTPRGYV